MSKGEIDACPATGSSDFERAAAQLLDRFERLWAIRDADLIRDIVAPDAVSHWSGLVSIAGHDYPERWRSLVHDLADELEFEVTGHAAQEPYLFISWRARATLGAQSVEYDGVDRFRVRGELADEVYVVFDSAPMSTLLRDARPGGAQR